MKTKRNTIVFVFILILVLISTPFTSASNVLGSSYEPYGEVLSGGDSRYLYTGKELDDQSGLYYLGQRYYDPFLTRFTQPDENIPDPYNPQDLNP
mgnify:FL=1